jgi:hypothetical protein
MVIEAAVVQVFGVVGFNQRSQQQAQWFCVMGLITTFTTPFLFIKKTANKRHAAIDKTNTIPFFCC